MAFCAAIATAVVLGACGSDIPGNAVVQIGDASITTASLDHWLAVANDTNQASTGVAAPALPLPPDYTKCVAEQRKTAGSAASTTSALKASCAQSYQALLSQILPFLIQTIWIQGEAVDRAVKVSDAKLESSFQQARNSSNPPLKTTAEMNSFLAKSGETIADLKWYLYVKLLYAQVELKVQKQASKVTSAAIAAYYKKNLAALTKPATRSLHLVETRTQASAATVKSLLAGGSSYATVAPKYSIDPTTKTAGGRMAGVSPSELNAQLSAVVFAAKQGVLSGPIKTAFGYYVFTVDSITPSSVPSLAAETATIRSQLTQQQVATAETALQTGLTKKWTARTNCRAGYVVAYCSNAPTTSTAATGATTGATSG
jgi:foldase protein PrsA